MKSEFNVSSVISFCFINVELMNNGDDKKARILGVEKHLDKNVEDEI